MYNSHPSFTFFHLCDKVKDMLAKKDYIDQSLLSLAAASGSKDVLEGVLLVIRREFTESEVRRSLASRNRTQEENKLDYLSVP